MALSTVPSTEIEARLERTRARLRMADVEAALIIQRADFFYLTGTAQNGLLSLPAESDGEPLLLVQKSRSRAREESPIARQEPLDSPRGLASALRAAGHGPWRRIGLELDVLPWREVRRLEEQFPGVEFVDISMPLREIRMVKSEYEIRQMEGAAEILARVFARVPEILRASEREIDAAAAIEGEMRRHRHQALVRIRRWNMELAGATVAAGPSASHPQAFDGADGSVGLYPAFPHSGSERPLVFGEPIMIDLVAGFGGYLADKTRIFVLGRLVDPELLEAHRFTLRLQAEIQDRLRPGAVCSSIYTHVMEQVSATAWQSGFMGWGENQVAFIGHGVGLELDELPILSARSSTALKEGMVVAIEPKIFFGERGGVGIENSWVVTADGCRNLTADSSDEIIEV
ncbi:MAG: Xaa-Pro peptidase family protein [Candidatus Eisenbacteria bacterium]|nr:Xaa-Pro peptidase family protein [Candidatus Eisenbacteria bacterium]